MIKIYKEAGKEEIKLKKRTRKTKGPYIWQVLNYKSEVLHKKKISLIDLATENLRQ